MINFKICPVCEGPLRYENDYVICDVKVMYDSIGYYHFHMYDNESPPYQKVYSYIGRKLMHFSNENNSIIFTDQFANCSINEIKSFDDFICLIKRYYKKYSKLEPFI